MGDGMSQGRKRSQPHEPGEYEQEEPVESAEERVVYKEKPWKAPKERSPRQRRAGYVAAIIINLILLYVANNLLAWRVPFITSEFVVPLQYLNISLIATAIANLLFFYYDPDWFLAISRTALNVIGVIVAYVFYTTFPFDFSSFGAEGLFTLLARIALILGIVGSVIGVIAEGVKFMQAISGATRV